MYLETTTVIRVASAHHSSLNPLVSTFLCVPAVYYPAQAIFRLLALVLRPLPSSSSSPPRFLLESPPWAPPHDLCTALPLDHAGLIG
jgi:hypothetical protein